MILALALIGSGRWLLSPRIDPRLVGDWQETQDPSEPDPFAGMFGYGIRMLSFRADGTSMTAYKQNIVGNRTPDRWRVDGGRLVIQLGGRPYKSSIDRLKIEWELVLDRIKGQHPEEDAYQIMSVTPTTFRLQSMSRGFGGQIPRPRSFERATADEAAKTWKRLEIDW